MATMSYYPNYQLFGYPAFNGHFQTAQGFVYTHDGPQDPWRPQQTRSHLIHQANSQRTTETKPRLAKEEVEQLEAEFQRNHKPNSSVKKGLAEQMRVDIARINNWFQNRRAKAKHEARQKQEQPQSVPTSPEQDSQPELPELSTASEDHDDESVSAISFPPTSSSGVLVGSDQSSQLRAATPPTLDTLNQPLESLKQEALSEYAPSEPMRFHNPEQHFTFSDAHNGFYARPTCDFQAVVCSPPSEVGHTTQTHLSMGLPMGVVSTIEESNEGLGTYVPLTVITDGLNGHLTTYPSQLLPNDAAEIKSERHQSEEHFDEIPYQQFSPASVHSPAVTPDLTFKAPPAVVDLASRRNKRCPAPIGTNSARTFSCGGPKTGIDMPKRTETASPMRRIASAGVGMPGRICKSVAGGPRSPMYFEKRPEALLHLARSPIMGAQPHSAAPPTPITPMLSHQQSLREATVSSTSSDEDNRAYTYQTAHFVMDSSIRTPPATPGLMSGFSEAMFPNPMETAFNLTIGDEPLATPVMGVFGSEADFPPMPNGVPSYITNAAASQPSTPGYPPATMGPTYFAVYPGSNQEYNWSEAPSARSSPGAQHRSRQLQFTNITPQDFQR